MARVYASDISHSLIPETNYAVTPTTGAIRYELPVSVDQDLLTAEATTIKSNTKRPNNAANGSQRGMVNVSGGVNMRGFAGAVHNVLLEGMLRSTFSASATKVLKPAQVDKSFTIISKLANDQLKANRGCLVTGFTLDAKATSEVMFNYDFQGVAQDLLTADIATSVTPATYVLPGEFEGSDVTGLAVAGNSASFSELSLQMTLDRPVSPVLGSNIGLMPGVNGAREIKVTVKLYRESLAMENLLTGNAQSFQFDVGIAGSGYRFQCPAVNFDIPKDELSEGSAFLTITGTAGYDNTGAADIIITQL